MWCIISIADQFLRIVPLGCEDFLHYCCQERVFKLSTYKCPFSNLSVIRFQNEAQHFFQFYSSGLTVLLIPRKHQRASVETATRTWRERGKHTSKKGMRKLRFSQTAVVMDEIKRKSQRFYRKQVGCVCGLAPSLHVRNPPRAQAQLFPTCHRCTTSGHPPPTARRLWSIFSSAQTRHDTHVAEHNCGLKPL